jgi:hypothetical protein
MEFWRFNSFFDETFTVTSRSKTIAALRLCVPDGNDSCLKLSSTAFPAKLHALRSFFATEHFLNRRPWKSQNRVLLVAYFRLAIFSISGKPL